MISDDEIRKAADIRNLQRKIRRAVNNEDSETFIESYLELVEESPDLFEMLNSLCGYFNLFEITAGGGN